MTGETSIINYSPQITLDEENFINILNEFRLQEN